MSDPPAHRSCRRSTPSRVKGTSAMSAAVGGVGAQRATASPAEPFGPIARGQGPARSVHPSGLPQGMNDRPDAREHDGGAPLHPQPPPAVDARVGRLPAKLDPQRLPDRRRPWIGSAVIERAVAVVPAPIGLPATLKRRDAQPAPRAADHRPTIRMHDFQDIRSSGASGPHGQRNGHCRSPQQRQQ